MSTAHYYSSRNSVFGWFLAATFTPPRTKKERHGPGHIPSNRERIFLRTMAELKDSVRIILGVKEPQSLKYSRSVTSRRHDFPWQVPVQATSKLHSIPYMGLQSATVTARSRPHTLTPLGIARNVTVYIVDNGASTQAHTTHKSLAHVEENGRQSKYTLAAYWCHEFDRQFFFLE